MNIVRKVKAFFSRPINPGLNHTTSRQIFFGLGSARKITAVILFCFIVLGPLGSRSFAQVVPIKEVLTYPDKFDKTIIVIQAEAVGENIRDKQGSWINVSCDGFNLGVYFSDDTLVQQVGNFGSYKTQGDILRIKGTFYKSCPFHFERDIHATSLEIIAPGGPLKEKLSSSKRMSSVALAIICLTLAFVCLIKLRYARRD